MERIFILQNREFFESLNPKVTIFVFFIGSVLMFSPLLSIKSIETFPITIGKAIPVILTLSRIFLSTVVLSITNLMTWIEFIFTVPVKLRVLKFKLTGKIIIHQSKRMDQQQIQRDNKQ